MRKTSASSVELVTSCRPPTSKLGGRKRGGLSRKVSAIRVCRMAAAHADGAPASLTMVPRLHTL
jgi:hypothetical protein